MATMLLTLQLMSILVMVFALLPKYGKHTPIPVKTAVKMAFLLSLTTTLMMLKHQIQSVSMTLTISSKPVELALTITLNNTSTIMLPTILFVAWSVMEFSTWYITPPQVTNAFTKAMLIFLLSMVILTCAGSLFQLFIGWEGVGIMSFILINWWSSRATTSTAALQAVIYNRIGDVGLILAMSILISHHDTLNLEQIAAQQIEDTLIAIGLILAATGKSAQFLMHTWLPAAMEGPTPVSALLHSSTMVVAGIYMLAQFHPLFNFSKYMLNLCLYFGTATSLFTASCALTQNDIKKIIAFSTSSQLGLMMAAVGIDSLELTIFHMVTHATFKATLFLSSGSIIHCMQSEQDMRKMGNISTTMPITASCLTINSMTLAGIPFLSGFYSKDTILETMISSHLNSWAMMALAMSTTMTSSYTLRMLIHTAANSPRHKPNTALHEHSTSQIHSILRPTLTTIILGLILLMVFLTLTMPLPATLKLFPTLTIIVGTTMTLGLINMSHNPQKHTPYKIWNQFVFYDTVFHRTFSSTVLKSSRVLTQLIDLIWLEKIGPKYLYTTNIKISKLTSMQTGLLKNYLIIFLIFIASLIMAKYH